MRTGSVDSMAAVRHFNISYKTSSIFYNVNIASLTPANPAFQNLRIPMRVDVSLSFPHKSSPHLLDIDLHTTLMTRRLPKLREQVGDIIPRMPVKPSAQPLLVKVMSNETDRATEHEQSVQDTVLEVVFCLFCAEGATVAHEIDEADSDAAVDVEDKVVFLGGCDGFDGDGVVEELGGWEVLQAELFDERHAEIWVVSRLYTVANTRDCNMLAPVTSYVIPKCTC